MLYLQGGLTGYASREIIATPQTDQQIRVGQAFAWNPSISGAEVKETFVLTESGPEMLTRSSGGGEYQGDDQARYATRDDVESRRMRAG